MSRIGKCVETESRLVGAKGRGRGNGECPLMGMGLPFGMMEIFRTRQVGWLYETVSVPNVTDFYILKSLK